MRDDLLSIGESSLVSAEWSLTKGMEEDKEDCMLGGTCSSGETWIYSSFLSCSVLFVSCVLRRLLRFLRRICPFSVLTTYDLGFTSSKTTAFLSQQFASSTLTMSFFENTFSIFVVCRLLSLLEGFLFLLYCCTAHLVSFCVHSEGKHRFYLTIH